MKALTLHQPWASLVSLGVKTIETRSWPTKYCGPLAIHAALRRPDVEMLEDGPAGELDGLHGLIEAEWACTPVCDFMPDRIPPPLQRWWIALAPKFDPVPMPLGAVVATCELVGCLPIIRWGGARRVACPFLYWFDDVLGICSVDGEPAAGVTSQIPYGDFTPGRWAWMLADVKPVEPPVPAKGHQGLWSWEP